MLRRNPRAFHLIYLLNFLLALSWALPSYMESSYLGQFVSVQYIGVCLAVSNAVVLPVAWYYPSLIRRFSNYRVMLTALSLTVLGLLALAVAQQRWVALTVFAAYYIPASLLAINIDVFLEDISDDRHTGRIRANLLLAANIAWAAAPVAMGWLAASNRYPLVFCAAAVSLLPAIAVLMAQKHHLRDHFRYSSRTPRRLFAAVRSNPNLPRLFLLALALRFFYFIMVMYIPFYLHSNLGFGWPTIGWIMTVMLLPFLFVQPPAGRIADRYLGEQEMMIAGFVIMAVTTGIIFFTTSNNPLVWAAILFATRVGAALVECMQETYFFKQVDRRDVDLINLYRNLGPAGWLIGALFSAIVLSFLPLLHIFLLLALLMLAALWPAMRLQDTN
ncbi:MAG: MFS transporter [Patescibacteria group bacterium]|nr:MFS transporter [Patescibacteria group bacterium]